MRLLHTADWHIGRTLRGHSLLEDQVHFLEQVFLPMVTETRPDVVLIAGDIYDRAVPPSEAVALLNSVLTRLVREHRTPVVVIPGNHDDAKRLSFGARLLEAAGVHIGDGMLGHRWQMQDEHGPVSIVAASYFEPVALAQALGDGQVVPDFDAGMALLAPRLHELCPPGERRVLVAHAFVAGGAVSDSERDLAVGGSGQIGVGRFEGFDYVALGHLHRPQSFTGGRVRYSGSPLAYSASEAGYQKSVSLVEMGPGGEVAVHELPIVPLRPLRVVRGEFAAVMEGTSEDYLQFQLTDAEPVYEAQRKLAQRYSRIVGMEWVNEVLPNVAVVPPGAVARAADPIALFERFYAATRQEAELPEDARPALIEAIEAARKKMSR